MPDVLLFTNTFTIEALTDPGDTYFLGEGITHLATEGSPTLELLSTSGEEENYNIFVNGTMSITGNRRIIVSDLTLTNLLTNTALTVSESGRILAGGNANAITIFGDDTTVTNNGEIIGGNALRLTGNSPTLTNSGEMISSFVLDLQVTEVYTIEIGGPDIRIRNSGLISGPNAIEMNGDAFVQNTGVIEARLNAIDVIHANASDRVEVFNEGTISGGRAAYITTGIGIDAITNSGTILGRIDTGEGNGFLNNTGTVQGTVTFGTDADFLRNSGTIDGSVLLEDGTDFVLNVGGTITTGVFALGLASNTVRNISGDINGFVTLGDGTDLFVNTGTVGEDVEMLGSNDVVTNFGIIAGNAELGEGNDRFHNIGPNAAVGGLIDGGGGNDTIVGGANADNILGGFGNDTLRGGDGNDTVNGALDADSILGDAGDDSLIGSGGADTIRGGDGDDQIDGGTEADELFGNAGNDTILGGDGNDTIRGGSGDDSIEGGLGNNNMNGGLGNDVVVGDVGNDLIRGNDGNDVVTGADGADTILGGEGNDTIAGGLGRDVLNGGLGADQFRFTSVTESGTGAARDLIQDFETGTDLIVLSPLPGVLDFIGTGAFTGTGAEVRAVEISGGLSTLVQIDGDGDGAVDSEILLSFTTGVTADDFLL